ncbi:hypothetical protein Pan153_45330 [Gimesia panareensis]|uniref:Uncharacterized protein n=1 Tax=Gimesia panareensis TaxID=2527978 RepID=A0A518FU41_9PLAN|nr:hypothetical protein [Gimesia panareensis]QDV19864.1 hypothetical protein Pan153_45330 [Gimesia panareensis]
MMSLSKNVNLKKVCLTAGCLLAVSLVSLPESSAGIIPWTYNAIFGPSRNGPMYYGAGYAPAPYTTNYGGYGMSSSCNSCGTGGYTAFYGGSRAASRRSSRAAYRWYLINNPQAVGVSYSSFNGGNMYASNYAGYAPSGCCSPCGMGGCSTGACGMGGCSTGACGVSYSPSSASTPTPDPNSKTTSGGTVPEPREIESTPPKTYAEEPMNPDKKVEDSGFGERRYDRKTPMDTPMPGSDAKDLFEQPLKRDASETPMPGSSTPAPDFGTPPSKPDFGTEPPQPDFGTEKKSDEDLFGTDSNKAFKPTPEGKLPNKTTIPQKKAAPTTQPEKKAPKAEQETNHLPPLRVRPLNLDQKITWKSAPRAERLTIRAHFTAPQIAKQDVPTNSGWYAIDDTARVASK